jgi:hypothetical protein
MKNTSSPPGAFFKQVIGIPPFLAKTWLKKAIQHKRKYRTIQGSNRILKYSL